MTEYASFETMRAARARYFEDSGFGADGGYGDAWVDFKIGPVPLPFPNTAARVAAVRYHDLHHVITGYGTDFRGELEISAWEIGAGCERFWVAWQLNLSGLFAGMIIMPRRTLRAFLRGRRSRSLYGLELEPLLAQTVGEVRTRVSLPEGTPRARPADLAWLALAFLAGGVVGHLTLAALLPLLPVAVVVLNRQRRAATEAAAAPSTVRP